MKASEYPERIDLGEGRYLAFTTDHDGHIIGAIECHPAAKDYDIPRTSGYEPFHVAAGTLCEGAMFFDVPEIRSIYVDPSRQLWCVESWQPLELSPSLLCRACGNHGFVRQGKWVPA